MRGKEQILSFREFQEVLAKELMLPPEALKPEASFVADLKVDSLALVSMMLRLEDLGISIPLEEAWEIETVEDAYIRYLDGMGAMDKKASTV